MKHKVVRILGNPLYGMLIALIIGPLGGCMLIWVLKHAPEVWQIRSLSHSEGHLGNGWNDYYFRKQYIEWRMDMKNFNHDTSALTK